MTVARQLLCVARAQLREDGIVGNRGPIRLLLVAAEKVGMIRIESGVMEESQRLAVDLESGLRARQRADGEVPIRDVPTGPPEDVHVEIARDEVNPSLVDEHRRSLVDEPLAAKAVGPPIQKRSSLGTDGDEAEVVRARPEDE